jgi:hypothetical protein
MVEERRSDEESLYYILERDLDREAIFQHHDGWFSQVSFGNGKRIDYVLRYGNEIYGIEVKTGSPRLQHFSQTEKYLGALNGIFLAYPSDRVGEALFLSESKQQYLDVGLISLTLFRSHIIRRVKRRDRQNEQIWSEYDLDERGYWKEVKSWSWERADGLPATLLKDGCFWVSFDPNGRYSEDRYYRLPFSKSNWQALAVLYAISCATSLDRYYSHKHLWNLCKEIGWKSFNPWPLVQCDLADVRTYGNNLWMYSLTYRAHFLMENIREALKENLGSRVWRKLTTKIKEWRERHHTEQSKHENEFARTE